MTTANDGLGVADGGFARRAAALAAIALPLSYAAYLGTVIVHEVVGHGLGAVAAGGSFTWFRVSLDGMGRAQAYAPGHGTFVLAAGILADLAVAIPLLFVGAWRRVGPLARLPAILFAMLLLNDAGPYAFWGAAYARGPSDTARIATAHPEARAWIVAAAAVVTVAAVWATTWLLYRAVEEAAGPLSRARAFVLAALLSVVGAGLWFLLDWDRLVPDSGRVPETVGAAMQAVVAWLLAWRWRPSGARVPIPRRRWIVSVVLAWAASAAIVYAVASWMQGGVSLE